jgi:hypothetical protein
MIQPPDGVCTYLSLAYLQEQIQTIGNNFLTIFYIVKPDSIKELTYLLLDCVTWIQYNYSLHGCIN